LTRQCCTYGAKTLRSLSASKESLQTVRAASYAVETRGEARPNLQSPTARRIHRRPPPRHRNRRQHCKQRVLLRSSHARLLDTRKAVLNAWLNVADSLDAQGDHILASHGRQFARHLPRVLTDGEHIAAALVAHSQQRAVARGISPTPRSSRCRDCVDTTTFACRDLAVSE
jgi:hypothetical protein